MDHTICYRINSCSWKSSQMKMHETTEQGKGIVSLRGNVSPCCDCIVVGSCRKFCYFSVSSRCRYVRCVDLLELKLIYEACHMKDKTSFVALHDFFYFLLIELQFSCLLFATFLLNTKNASFVFRFRSPEIEECGRCEIIPV